jgi:hypothetical protein
MSFLGILKEKIALTLYKLNPVPVLIILPAPALGFRHAPQWQF